MNVYAAFGISLPHYSGEQINYGQAVSYEQLQPGDLICFSGHVAIYIGGGQVIHASGTKVGVVQTPIGNSGWTHWLKIPYINYD